MKQRLFLSTVLAVALAAGAAHAQTAAPADGPAAPGPGFRMGPPMGLQTGPQSGPQAGPRMGMPQPGVAQPQVGLDVIQDQQSVTQIQRALSQQGYDVAVDGVWGAQTRNALEQFQRQRGIMANGMPNRQTLAALNIQPDMQPSPGIAEAPGLGIPGTAPHEAPGLGQQEPTQDALVTKSGPLGSPTELAPGSSGNPGSGADDGAQN